MVNYSPICFLLFALFFYSHFNRAFDDAENSPIGVQDRANLLARADACVLRYLQKETVDMKIRLMPHILKRCALTEYFPLEKFGNRLNGSSIYSFFPLFQHSHLRKCNSFLFFGTSSYDMSAEIEIMENVDFEMLKCNYLVVDRRKNLYRLKNYIQLPELTEKHLIDLLLKYKDDKDYVIEHLYIAETSVSESFINKLMNIRKLFSLTACQITIRFPSRIPDNNLWKFLEDILVEESHVLMNFQQMDTYSEVFLFANNEYQCIMRYV